MQYFYRAHLSPDDVLTQAEAFFSGHGFTRHSGTPNSLRFGDSRGTVNVAVAIEGGHYTRVTLGTGDVGESEIDRVAKRFLAELHATEDAGHRVRGAY